MLTSASFAQTEEENRTKNFIGVMGGASFVYGNLSNTNYWKSDGAGGVIVDKAAGYSAKVGSNFGIEGAYYFSKYVGIGGAFSMTTVNVGNLQSMSSGYQYDFDVDTAIASSTTRYHFYNFFVGPYFSLPAKKFTFDLRILAGLTEAYNPEFDVNVIDGGKPHPFAQNVSHGAGFGMQTGLAVRYALAKHFGIKLSADYYYADPNINITYSNRVQQNTGRYLTNYHESVGMLNVNLGLFYQFGK